MLCVKVRNLPNGLFSESHLTMKELSAKAEIWYIGRSYMYISVMRISIQVSIAHGVNH